MKTIKGILLATVLLVSLVGNNAWAQHAHFHRYHSHVGVYIGAPLVWPLWPSTYYYPYYPYQPVIVEPAAPTVYVERSDVQTTSPQIQNTSNYWYYCHNPDGYYPYIKECPNGWQKVIPQPMPHP
jgi:hypothetical protein